MKIVEPTAEQKRLLRYDEFKTVATGWVLFAGMVLLFTAGGILAWQCIGWLDTGVWPPLTWQTGFDWMGVGRLETSAVGLQRILNWFGSLPLCTMLRSLRR